MTRETRRLDDILNHLDDSWTAAPAPGMGLNGGAAYDIRRHGTRVCVAYFNKGVLRMLAGPGRIRVTGMPAVRVAGLLGRWAGQAPVKKDAL